MSQKKVDAYKAEKAKRKETVESNKKKQKAKLLGARIAGLVVAAAIVVALVFTGINAYKSSQNAKPTYDISNYAVNDYAGIEKQTEEPTSEAESQSEAESESAEQTEEQTEEPTTAAP